MLDAYFNFDLLEWNEIVELGGNKVAIFELGEHYKCCLCLIIY